MKTRVLLLFLLNPMLVFAEPAVDSLVKPSLDTLAGAAVGSIMIESPQDSVKQVPVISPRALYPQRKPVSRSVSPNIDVPQINEDVLKALESRCDSLKRDLDALLPLRKELAQKLLREYGNYFDVSFASISPHVADSLVDLCQVLKVPELEDFVRKKEETMGRKAIYDTLSALKYKKYVKSAIDSAKLRLDSLSCCSPNVQKKEVIALRNTLASFPEAIVKTRHLVEIINETMGFYRPDGNKKAALSTLDSILQDYDQDIRSYVNRIPYLKTLFNRMLKDLRANPLKQGAAETELLKMK